MQTPIVVDQIALAQEGARVRVRVRVRVRLRVRLRLRVRVRGYLAVDRIVVLLVGRRGHGPLNRVTPLRFFGTAALALLIALLGLEN